MKKILTLYCFLSFTNILLLAQSNNLSVKIGVNSNYRTIIQIVNDDKFSDIILESRVSDSRRYLPSISLLYSFEIDNKIEFSTGISYNNLGYYVPESSLKFPDTHNGNGGFSPYIDVKNRFNIHAVTLPLLCTYKIFEKNNFSLNLSGGALASYLISQNKIYDYRTPLEKEPIYTVSKTNYDKLQIGSRIGVQTNFKIKQNLSVLFEPSFNYYFNKLKFQGLEENLHNMSFQTGLIYHFNKKVSSLDKDR